MKYGSTLKTIAVFVSLSFLYQVFFPTIALALTGGPTQPEVTSFEPVGTTEMVDPFSGDFVYNIPLMEVGGYPLNIAYHSGISMDQEAGWVGLGWSLNPGVLNRNMRGIPDDFKGDKMRQEINMKDHITTQTNLGYGWELFGQGEKDYSVQWNTSLEMGILYNNYKGVGLVFGAGSDLAGSCLATIKDEFVLGLNVQAAMNLTLNSHEGFSASKSINPGLSLGYDLGSVVGGLNSSYSFGTSFNSRTGAKSRDKGFSWKVGTIDLGRSGGFGQKRNSSIPFGTQTYVPYYNCNLYTSGTYANFKVGWENKGCDQNITAKIMTSTQKVTDGDVEYSSYGYLNDNFSPGSIRDFNREKDGAYHKEATKNLGLVNLTYDIFMAKGQGIASVFKPKKPRVEAVFDKKVSNTGTMDRIGQDMSFTDYLKYGINWGTTSTNSWSGLWQEGINQVKNYFEESDDYLYEKSWFAVEGEKTHIDEDYYNYINGDALTEFELSGNGDKVELDGDFAARRMTKRQKRNQVISYLEAEEAQYFGLEKNITSYDEVDLNDLTYPFEETETIDRLDGTIRKAHHISEFTALQTDGSRYVYGIPAYNILQREVGFNVHDDGTADDINATIPYVSTGDAPDNSRNNVKGIDHYFSANELPPYAHSFLLTAVLSSDYIDLTGDGVTDDDYGSAIKFNYTRHKATVNGEETPYYNWRIPVEDANHQKQLRSYELDDKGNYIYGQKEIWYVHSIESKTHVAVFETSKREDAYGVINENGGVDVDNDKSMPLRKLDKIVLYSKEDLRKNGSNATPLKIVEFEYDYSLCGNVPNNSEAWVDVDGNVLSSETDPDNVNSNKGKLTLKAIYFTYGNSPKGRLNPYQFDYGKIRIDNDDSGTLQTIEINPDYMQKAYDRWGNFSPNPVYEDVTLYTYEHPYVSDKKVPENSEGIYFDKNFQSYTSSGTDRYQLYDYNNEDRYMADYYAYAWNMTDITLPSGGTIRVEYESDDYAFVQDQRVMDLIPVSSICDDDPSDPGNPDYDAGSPGSTLYEYWGSLPDVNNPYEWIVIDLPVYVLGVNDFKNLYMGSLNQLYFKSLVTMFPSSDRYPTKLEEYITGYIGFEGYKLDESSRLGPYYTKVFIRMRMPGLLESDETDLSIANFVETDKTANPIAEVAWQFARNQMAHEVFKEQATKIEELETLDGPSATGFLAAFRAIGQDLSSKLIGFNRSMIRQGIAESLDLDRTWIKLMNPEYLKKGGGHRVKKIIMDDVWDEMTGNDAMNYGQEYSYKYYDDELGRLISSGVASYGPQMGNEENPFRFPVYQKIDKTQAPDDYIFTEGPFGESFFPSPSVGYSRVTIKNLKPDADGDGTSEITKTGTGFVVQEFYTAKDFPTLFENSQLQTRTHSPKHWKLYFAGERLDYVTAAQGYVIKLNDMHGKLRAVKIYGEHTPVNEFLPDDEFLVSKTEYEYRSKEVDDHRVIATMNNYNNDNENRSATVKALSNTVPMIDQDGNIFNGIIGVEVDLVNDFRKSETVVDKKDHDLNVDIIPFPMPTYYGIKSYIHSRFQSVVTTKVVFNYGILNKVITTDENGAEYTVENMLWDAETGEVLVTNVNNEYDDLIYASTYPAYWAYDRMGPAYQNINAVGYKLKFDTDYSIMDFTNMGDGSSVSFDDLLVPGDEVCIYELNSDGTKNFFEEKYWVYENGGSYYLIDENGYTPHQDIIDMAADNDFYLKVIRSGRRNQQMLPMAAVTSLRNPLNGTSLDFSTNLTAKILDASAVEYSEDWRTYCCGNEIISEDNSKTGVAQVVFEYDGTNLVGIAIGSSDLVFDIETLGVGSAYLLTVDEEYQVIKLLNGNNQFQLSNGDWITVSAENVVELEIGGVTYSILKAGAGDEVTYYEGLSDQGLLYVSPCQITPCNVVNPYQRGILGNWRPLKSYVYLTDRNHGKLTTSTPELRNKGIYEDFSPFWVYSGGVWTKGSDANWIWNSEATIYSPFGYELESKDPLNRYASGLYGYHLTKPVAVASNARQKQIAFDGFEEKYYKDPRLPMGYCVTRPHLSFLEAIEYGNYEVRITNEEWHSGHASIVLEANTSVSVYRPLTESTATTPTDVAQYRLDPSDCIPPFKPDAGQYVLSAWIKKDVSGDVFTYDDDDCIEVSFKDELGATVTPSISAEYEPSGKIIDEWQRIYGIFEIPATAAELTITLRADGDRTYFDDLRIHPINSNMKSFVYDYTTQRLDAELDENNYATFFEYDEEGNLVRIKKETENGIMTIQESRQHIKSNY